MAKAIVFIANGSEEIEALTPVDYLRRAGVEVMLVGIGGKTVTCSHGVTIVTDKDSAEYGTNVPTADAIIVPGGMPGATNIAANAVANNTIRAANESGKLVCAICAAPAVVLPQTGALAGKRWTCYPNMEGEAGSFAETHQADLPFIHDKNLITGRGPGAAEQWSMEIVRTLCGEAVAKKIATGSCQRE